MFIESQKANPRPSVRRGMFIESHRKRTHALLQEGDVLMRCDVMKEHCPPDGGRFRFRCDSINITPLRGADE